MRPGISSMALLQGMLLPEKAGPLFAEVLSPTRVTPVGSSMPQQVSAQEHPPTCLHWASLGPGWVPHP